MNVAANAHRRMRATAARSPFLRKLAGKPPPQPMTTDAQGVNASAWVVGDDQLWPIAERYATFPLLPLSYGTVRDYVDSTEHIPGVAGANFDMKDMQRCWMIKAIVGNVERGSRILEIGAGEPLVAGILARLGYDVTAIDPYAGAGNGPREFEAFEAGYPDVSFIRDEFPPAEPLGKNFSAVYSISVLDHVPLERIEPVIAGAQALLAEKQGCSIHAVDHVVAGWGAESHLEGLRQVVKSSKLSTQELDEVIARLERDSETYFVSAEAHNRWRGDLDYDQYPMRRIASVNLFARA